MAASKSRQRALARAKAERQIARRAQAARRRRQWQAGTVGVLALALVAVGTAWATGAFEPEPKKPDDCAWTKVESTQVQPRNEVGTPPTTGIAKSGAKTMTITTNEGVISALLDPAKAPCTVASYAYLAGKQFFKDTKCHRLTTAILQCGDPTGTGSGGPTYKFPDENLPAPTGPNPNASANPSAPAPELAQYSRGMIAMANSGQNTNGSQFFLVYKDTQLPPSYTIFGTISSGLDVVDKIAAGGIAPGQDGAPSSDGAPKTEVKIQTLTVTDGGPTAQQQPSASPTGSAKP